MLFLVSARAFEGEGAFQGWQESGVGGGGDVDGLGDGAVAGAAAAGAAEADGVGGGQVGGGQDNVKAGVGDIAQGGGTERLVGEDVGAVGGSQ
ncbi:hypothetical protein ACFXDH_51250 [Streptomyces sp. NPDC059467]|uniref:hypothetical protein n=1 Tax=Streptomyces sp. NPDC059467 TaxID=3346844 RepID=UPI0036999C36